MTKTQIIKTSTIDPDLLAETVELWDKCQSMTKNSNEQHNSLRLFFSILYCATHSSFMVSFVIDPKYFQGKLYQYLGECEVFPPQT